MSKQTELDAKAAALLDSEGAMGVARLAVEFDGAVDLMTEILEGVSVTVRGEPSAPTLHSWHDLADRVSALKTERDELAASVERLRNELESVHDCITGSDSDCFGTRYTPCGQPYPVAHEVLDGIAKAIKEAPTQSIRQSQEGGS